MHTPNPTTGPAAPDPGLLDKVRKLLAKAEDDACTPAEAEAFTAKAAALIAKYGIDQALLADTTPGTDVVGDRVVEMDAPYARDKAGLLAGIAHALRCKTVCRTRHMPGDGKRLSMHLFGFGADLDRVELLYTSLLVQAAHALVAAYVPWGQHPASYRRSWYAGYSTAIHRRLRAAEAQARSDAERVRATEHTGRSVALVLADRSALVDQARAAAYPNLTAGRARRLSGTGDRDGYAAGQRADLGTTRISRAGRKAVR
ncbi:DUF2786 domain-containing protein [Krasilnikovia sp. M28-CT-15]|uniref:DUF2786 domain-containing protein n=1 Tax=Krasilnikovia sp. M28-CT-15 TaxID=3373540 RepID=UPI0038763C87